MISGFLRFVNEAIDLLGCYAAWIIATDVSVQPIGRIVRDQEVL